MSGRLRIKRIYDEPSDEDDQRVLVDRLWPRGVRRDAEHLGCWFKDIAPTPGLRKWFGHEPRRFDEFGMRYRQELDANSAAVAQLHQMLERGDVTLLYAARDRTINHATVLADYARKHFRGMDAGEDNT